MTHGFFYIETTVAHNKAFVHAPNHPCKGLQFQVVPFLYQPLHRSLRKRREGLSVLPCHCNCQESFLSPGGFHRSSSVMGDGGGEPKLELHKAHPFLDQNINYISLGITPEGPWSKAHFWILDPYLLCFQIERWRIPCCKSSAAGPRRLESSNFFSPRDPLFLVMAR